MSLCVCVCVCPSRERESYLNISAVSQALNGSEVKCVSSNVVEDETSGTERTATLIVLGKTYHVSQAYSLTTAGFILWGFVCHTRHGFDEHT